MQFKRNKHKRSIKKDPDTSTATQQPQQEKPSWSIYLSISELPLSRYMDVVCDDNLYALIKSGFPPQEEIMKAWASIQDQCNDAGGDSEFIVYSRTFSEIANLSTIIKLIEHAVYVLNKVYHKGFADELNKLLRTNFDFSKEDRHELLKRCIRRTASIKMNLQLKIDLFESMQKKFSGAKKPERNYFLSMLICLSDHAGFQLHDSIVVFEFYERIKRLNKYSESLKAQKHVRRTS